jgi:hypothetical protein
MEARVCHINHQTVVPNAFVEVWAASDDVSFTTPILEGLVGDVGTPEAAYLYFKLSGQ